MEGTDSQIGYCCIAGACECSLACSTCHVIVEVSHRHPYSIHVKSPATLRNLHDPCMHAAQNAEYYKRLPEPSEDELDMLDLAFGLTDT